MNKTLASLALAAALTSAGAVGAYADTTYPAPAPEVAVSAGTVKAGDPVSFSGGGFTPDERIDITVEQAGTAAGGGSTGAGAAGRSVPGLIPGAIQDLAATADAQGTFSVDLVIREAGTYTLTAVGATSGVTRSSTVTITAPELVTPVVPASVDNAATLADTGADASLILWSLVGAGALGAGAVSVAVARRGSRTATAS